MKLAKLLLTLYLAWSVYICISTTYYNLSLIYLIPLIFLLKSYTKRI